MKCIYLVVATTVVIIGTRQDSNTNQTSPASISAINLQKDIAKVEIELERILLQVRKIKSKASILGCREGIDYTEKLRDRDVLLIDESDDIITQYRKGIDAATEELKRLEMGTGPPTKGDQTDSPRKEE